MDIPSQNGPSSSGIKLLYLVCTKTKTTHNGKLLAVFRFPSKDQTVYFLFDPSIKRIIRLIVGSNRKFESGNRLSSLMDQTPSDWNQTDFPSSV
jgi:hypothetical protein